MRSTHASTQPSPDATPSSGGRLVAVDGRVLPLKSAALHADARAGLARVTLLQRFENPFAEPLKVTYQLPLPADGAVSGFAFTVAGERVVGEVDTRRRARERFETALLQGRTAAVLEQERSSLFSQEVGNVPPGAAVECEVQVDQKLAWLPEGAWEWRFPTVVSPRYLGEAGRVTDAAKLVVAVADAKLPVSMALGLSVRDALAAGARVESTSHALHTEKGLGRVDASFADERGARLDRDVVVRWRVATPQVGCALELSRPARAGESMLGLLTLVPPTPGARQAVARDLIVLLDTSGSMGGAPLDQARRVTGALIDSLTEQDQLELIEFSNAPRRWKSGSVAATAAHRQAAQAWLSRLHASGGTEMRDGIIEALQGLRPGAQRQVVLITDGQIGGEHEVLEAIGQRLPAGSRVHTVGVGSSVNRSLTQPAARLGRGVELVIGLDDDAEVAVARILARTAEPLVTQLSLSGSALEQHAPARLPDLFGGAPALLSMKLRASGGELVVRGQTAQGDFEERLQVAPIDVGTGAPAVATLFAREAVEDLEIERAVSRRGDLDAQVEALGLRYQIATRVTSWVAVSQRVTVDPTAPTRQVTQPQELAYGLSAEGLGLRPTVVAAPAPMASLGAGLAPRGRVMKSTARLEQAPSQGEEIVASDDESALSFEEAEAGPARRMSARAAPRAAGSMKDLERQSVSEAKKESTATPPAEPQPMADVLAAPAAEKVSAPAPAPAAPPPPAPARPSLAGLAKRLLGQFGVGVGGTTPARRLRGTVTVDEAGRLVLNLTLDGPLDWAPGSEARVELADGSVVQATVVMTGSTRPGSYGAGLTLVVTLSHASGPLSATRVHLVSGPEVLEVSLQG
jgi:Ca-activated chloride channel family protein